jgi:outer membrane autotransporter protein
VLVAANQIAQSTMTDAGPGQLFLAPDTPIRVWTMGFGNYQSLAGSASTGASSVNVQTGGAAVGIERQFAPDFLAGFALGGSGSGYSSPNANANGSLTGAQAGVYATKSFGPYYLTGSLAFGYFDNSTTRSITDLTTPETATGSYASYQFSGRMEAGRRFTVEAFEQDYGVTPFAALEGSNLWQNGYTESSVNAAGGAGIAGLTYQAQQVGSLPTTLGFQLDTQFKSEDGKTWAPYLRLGWQHEFMTTRNVTAALTAIPDNGFTAQGAPAASDTAMIDLGLKVLYSKNLSMFINASSQMAGSFLSYGGKAGLMWAF